MNRIISKVVRESAIGIGSFFVFINIFRPSISALTDVRHRRDLSLQVLGLDVARPTCELSLIRWRKRVRVAAGKLEDDEYRIHLSARDGQ